MAAFEDSPPLSLSKNSSQIVKDQTVTNDSSNLPWFPSVNFAAIHLRRVGLTSRFCLSLQHEFRESFSFFNTAMH